MSYFKILGHKPKESLVLQGQWKYLVEVKQDTSNNNNNNNSEKFKKMWVDGNEIEKNVLINYWYDQAMEAKNKCLRRKDEKCNNVKKEKLVRIKMEEDSNDNNEELMTPIYDINPNITFDLKWTNLSEITKIPEKEESNINFDKFCPFTVTNIENKIDNNNNDTNNDIGNEKNLNNDKNDNSNINKESDINTERKKNDKNIDNNNNDKSINNQTNINRNEKKDKNNDNSDNNNTNDNGNWKDIKHIDELPKSFNYVLRKVKDKINTLQGEMSIPASVILQGEEHEIQWIITFDGEQYKFK